MRIRTFATFVLTGRDLEPQAVTHGTGLRPTHLHLRGEVPSSGAPPFRHGQWQLSSRSVVESDDLEDHLSWLLDRLEPVVDRLPPHVPRDEAFDSKTSPPGVVVAKFFCYWASDAVGGGPRLNPHTLERIGRMNAALELDVYILEETGET